MVQATLLNDRARPRISVCVANYNGDACLRECLDSILMQDGDIPVEIIVHDDASTDGSLALLAEHYPAVKVLASAENVGYCVSNNRMVLASSGENILLLNNDAVLFKDALVTLLDEATHGASRAVLSLPQYDYQSGGLVDRGLRLDLLHTPTPNVRTDQPDVAYVIGACLFIPRALWDDIGGFPESFGSIGEDLYLCAAARLRGASVRVAPRSGYRHHQGASFGGNRITAGRIESRYRRRFLSERNRLQVMLVCTPTLLVWPWAGLHCAALLVEAFALCVLLRSVRPWRGIYAPALCDTARQWSRLMALRRHVQSARTCRLRDYLRPFVLAPRKLVLLWRHGVPGLQD